MYTKIQSNKKGININWISQDNILIYMTIILFTLFSFISPGFFSLANFFAILRSMSIITILGLGLTFVITAGEIDLSIGTLPAFSGAVFAYLLTKSGLPLSLAFLISFISSIMIGLINGSIVAYVKVPSIVVTLATNIICYGITYIICNNSPIVIFPTGNALFLKIFSGNIIKFPVIVLWMIVFVVAGYLLLHRTKFGRNVAFIGNNKIASFYSGINVNDTIIFSFAVCSLCSFAVGMLGVAQASNASPWMYSTELLTAIAASIIGGTSFTGGKGNILGVVIGGFFLTMLTNGLLILGVPPWILYSINGAIIIFALSWGQFLKAKS